MTNRKAYFPIFLGLAVAIGVLIGANFNFKNKTALFVSNTQEAKIKKLINYIEYDYVDEVDTDGLLDEAITEMLVKLDPHSVYIPKEELQRVTETMQGKFVGIGVSFLMRKDTIVVSSVIDGGPSEKAGLKAGDRILMADKDTLFGNAVKRMAGVQESEYGTGYASRKVNATILKTLKGEADTEVNVQIYRKSTKEFFEMPIVRGEVALKSVPVNYMVTPNLGYIKINRFARTTYNEFKESLDKLVLEGMNSLVLDLRGNPGGFMDIADKIVDEFLEDGKLIVFTKNKNGEVDRSFATSKGDFEQGRVYVLIDQESASASEIVAGALQDNDKGTIVGRRSYGKGLVQQEMDLGDGSAVRLTISRYYTPTGRSIQKPYNAENSKKYDSDYLERIHSGELVSRDSIKVVDSLKYTTPKGKIVYGGGGIIPDVFVPIDTSTVYRSRIFRPLDSFVFNYVDNNRQKLSEWELDDFIDNFDKNDKLLNEYMNQLDLNVPISPKTKENLKRYLNAYVAQNLFEDNGFYRIIQQKDNMILKVKELESEN